MSNLLRAAPLLALLLSACSSVSDQRPEPIRKGEYFLEHGVNAFENSDYVAASDFLRKALAHYRSIDNTTGILLSHINLAETSLAAGNFSAAVIHIDAAEKISASSSFVTHQPRLTLLRAQVYWRQHQQQEALTLLDALLPAFDEEQRSKGKPTLLQLGATTLRTAIAFNRPLNERPQAHLWLRRLTLMLPATEGKTELHQARLLRFEAQISHDEKDYASALGKLEQALTLYREAAARPAIAATLTETGKLLIETGRWKEAEEKLQRALYIRLWIMDRPGAKELFSLLETTYQQLGDDEKAREMHNEYEKIGAS